MHVLMQLVVYQYNFKGQVVHCHVKNLENILYIYLQ